MKKALIFGVSGQDGAYLARLLLSKGYAVYGVSRDAQMTSFRNLEFLGIRDRVTTCSASLTDFRSVLEVVARVAPDEIYNLAGQSSVGLSFAQPADTFLSVSLGTLNLLEAVRFAKLPARLYNASSSECFGDAKGAPAASDTPFSPRSPYAVAKAAAFWQVANYREAYDLFACSGILFNHESPLRPERFVTRKIINAACRIARGSRETLRLGDLSVSRDWGWAPEYVEAMWRMLDRDEPRDCVIATGQSHSLETFVERTFAKLGLEYRQHVTVDPELFRPTDIRISRADPAEAERLLGWKAKYAMDDVIAMMLEHQTQST